MADPKDDEKKNADDIATKAEQEKLAKAARQADAAGKPSKEAIAKALNGLTFRTNKALPVLDDSTGKPVMEGGKPKMRHIPDLRPMTAADVLNAYYDGSELVIVSKDGSKYRTGK